MCLQTSFNLKAKAVYCEAVIILASPESANTALYPDLVKYNCLLLLKKSISMS